MQNNFIQTAMQRLGHSSAVIAQLTNECEMAQRSLSQLQTRLEHVNQQAISCGRVGNSDIEKYSEICFKYNLALSDRPLEALRDDMLGLLGHCQEQVQKERDVPADAASSLEEIRNLLKSKLSQDFTFKSNSSLRMETADAAPLSPLQMLADVSNLAPTSPVPADGDVEPIHSFHNSSALFSPLHSFFSPSVSAWSVEEGAQYKEAVPLETSGPRQFRRRGSGRPPTDAARSESTGDSDKVKHVSIVSSLPV